MFWHPDGTYLAVKVDRQKSKNTKSYSFELFRLKEREVPIEVLELQSPVVTFAWEPKGHRFCLVHGEPPRVDCSFYTMLNQGKAQVTLQKTLEKKPVNEFDADGRPTAVSTSPRDDEDLPDIYDA